MAKQKINIQQSGGVLGFAETTSDFTTASTSFVQVTGLSVTVNAPGNRTLEVTANVPQPYITGGTAPGWIQISIWDGTVGSGTELGESIVSFSGLGANNAPINVVAYTTPSAGSKTYNVGIRTSSSNTAHTSGSANTRPTLAVKG